MQGQVCALFKQISSIASSIEAKGRARNCLPVVVGGGLLTLEARLKSRVVFPGTRDTIAGSAGVAR